MKKIVILTLALMSLSALTYAQNARSFYRSSYESRNSGSFRQSSSLLTLGYGFPNQAVPGYVYGFGYNGYSRFGIGPLYLKYEHGFLRDEIGLGGHIAFSNSWVKYSNGSTSYTDNVVAFSAALKGFYHFNKLIPVDKLDVYAGVGLSFWNRVYRYDSDYNGLRPDYNDTAIYPVLQVGARFYVTSKIGLYAEVGYDQMSTANIGVTFRL